MWSLGPPRGVASSCVHARRRSDHTRSTLQCFSAASKVPRHAWQQKLGNGLRGRPGRQVCRATVDDPELLPLVQKMQAMRPVPPKDRPQLEKAVAMIDEANSKVEWQGRRHPYRLLYSTWLTDWVRKLDDKAADELYILARGRNLESWKLSEIKRDDYSPNTVGMRQWEGDRRRAQAARLTDVMKAAGYGEAACKLVEEVMLDRDIPDPRDIRRHDLVAPLGGINYRLLEQACMIQTLRDAEALVFVEKSFPQLFAQSSADEVLPVLQRELSRISYKCAAIILSMRWTPVQKKLINKALPAPRRMGSILGDLEGVAAASVHPGDWRYRNFDYE